MLTLCPPIFPVFWSLRSLLAIAFIHTKQDKYVHLNVWATTKRCYCVPAKRRPCAHHKQFLQNLAGVFQQFQGIVVWKARDLALGRHFSQLSWTPGRTASSGHNYLAAQALKENQLDWGSLNEQERSSEPRGNLPTALRNSEKHMNLKGSWGTTAMFLIVPRCCWKFTLDLVAACHQIC